MEAFTTTSTPFLDGSIGTVGASLEATISPYWDQEADYTYYDHGPLARTLIGEQSVQGIDYVYTLQGWIKSVNSNDLSEVNDPGQDGSGTSINRLVAKDVASYSLHYFEGDYQSISGYNHFIADQSGSQLDDAANSSNLYNGNIRKMVTTITNPNTRAILPMGNAYQYDQLNRLKQSKSFTNFNFGSNAWGSSGPDQNYFNSFDYDANGNITGQIRKDDAGNRIDDLIYYYPSLSNGKKSRNRLYHVYDDPALTGNYTDDIDNMTGSFDNGVNINTANNYAYDAEGRLIKDNQSGIANISWRVDGKVSSIRNVIEGANSLVFEYDAMGHRIAKHVYSADFSDYLSSTYYVLDAQGNVMSVYERKIDFEDYAITFEQTEKHIYGSSRVGIYNESLPLLGTQNAEYSQTMWTHTIGKRSYELQNHLGNVLTVISDKPIPHTTTGTTVDYFLAEILNTYDYSAFHAPLTARTLTKTSVTKDYRYGGADGQEKVDEVAGKGNHYTAEYWEYDSRLGRRWNIDPVTKDHESPYACFSNSPIWLADPNGADTAKYQESISKAGYDKAAEYANLSQTFQDFMAKFTSKEGAYHDIKLEFRSVKDLQTEGTKGVPSFGRVTMLYKGKPIGDVSSLPANAKIADFTILFELKEGAKSPTTEAWAVDELKCLKTATLIHMLLLHANTFASMIDENRIKDGTGKTTGINGTKVLASNNQLADIDGTLHSGTAQLYNSSYMEIIEKMKTMNYYGTKFNDIGQDGLSVLPSRADWTKYKNSQDHTKAPGQVNFWELMWLIFDNDVTPE